ncbi:MAG: hypothetical protein N3C59_03410 [Azovibrio sp.]|nr:hypothetical protein [Azovibrio sp.]
MSDWPLLHLTILCLFIALGMQVWAAAWALLRLWRAGPFWLPWAAFTLALVGMVPRRWLALELTLSTGLYDFSQALLAFAVSFLFLLAMPGLSLLLRRAVAASRQNG